MSGNLPSWVGPAAVAFAAGIGGGLLLARLLNKDAVADGGSEAVKQDGDDKGIRGVSSGREAQWLSQCARAGGKRE